MAICFVRAKVVSRGGGGSAAAAAAYRSGEKIKDEATGKTHDYTKKQGIDHSEILSPIAATAGNEWLTNRSALWNRVEAVEKRYDAQLAREMIIAIPRELTQPDQIELVRKYVQTTFVDRGMIADINLHHLDGTNPHAHVMLTMRELKIDERGIVSFGNKDRTWNDKKLLENQIKEWEIVANQYLERAGVDTRIDSRSYAEQGISRIPQIHLGKNVTAMRRQGIPTERGDLYDQIDKANEDIRAQLEIIYQAEGAICDLGNAEPSRPQREVNDQPKPNRPDFERHRRNLSNVGRDDGESISRQGGIRNQPGADRQTDCQTRTDGSRSSQPDEVSRNTRQPIGASSDHPENRPDPDLQSARSVNSTSSSDTNFSSTKARLIELSNRAKARRPGAAASDQGDNYVRANGDDANSADDIYRIRSEHDQGQYAPADPGNEGRHTPIDRQVSPGASGATEGGKEGEAQKAITLKDLNDSAEAVVIVKVNKPEKKRSSGMGLSM